MIPLRKFPLRFLFATALLLAATSADSQEATPAQTPAASASIAPAANFQDATAVPLGCGWKKAAGGRAIRLRAILHETRALTTLQIMPEIAVSMEGLPVETRRNLNTAPAVVMVS
jgi:hypothetical protein